MVARPWAAQHAWTVNLRTPAVANLFVTGSSLTESVVGRVFTQDIKDVYKRQPHRCWCPSIQNLGRAKQYADAMDPPANLEDDFADRPELLKMTEQTLLNHFNVWSDEHLIKEVVPEDIQKMLSCPESKPLHTQYDWEMPEWVLSLIHI